jgi:hypothetical protein
MKRTILLTGVLTVTVSLAIQAEAQPFLTNDLIAYYPFNGNANDASGNRNDGIVLGPVPATNRFGAGESAYLFNGSSSTNFIVIPSLASANLSALTLSLWVNPFAAPSANGNGNIINKWQGYSYSSEDYELEIYRDLKVDLGNGRHGVRVYGVQAPNPLSLGHWQHLVGTFDSAGTGTFYINGILCAQANGLPLLPPARAPVRIGQMFYADGSLAPSFDGIIDDVRIYNRALSASEVQQLYQYESQPSATRKDGLVAYYPLDGNANDESGHRHHGVAENVSPAPDRFGSSKGACRFNGVNSVITIRSLASLNPDEITLFAWIKPLVAPTTWGPIITKWRGYSQTLDQFHLTLQPDLHLAFVNGRHGAGYNAQENHCAMQSGNPLSLDHWYHVAATLDTAGTGRIWIDGAQQGEEDILPLRSGASEPPRSEGRPARFGFQHDGGSLPVFEPSAPEPVRIGQMIANDGRILETFNGLIDEVRIYDRALSKAEIEALYKNGKGGRRPPVSPKSGSSEAAAQVTVELRDGSRLVGTLAQEALSVHSEVLGDLRIPVARIVCLQWPEDDETKAHLKVVNGDELLVKVTTAELRLKTCFGEVKLAPALIRQVQGEAGVH